MCEVMVKIRVEDGPSLKRCGLWLGLAVVVCIETS